VSNDIQGHARAAHRAWRHGALWHLLGDLSRQAAPAAGVAQARGESHGAPPGRNRCSQKYQTHAWGKPEGKLRRRRTRIEPALTTNAEDAAIPTVTELEVIVKPRSFWRSFFWSLGNLALLFLLAGQIIYFYHDELAADPSWRPVVREFCDHAGCELRPRQDIARIELLQTSIAPHPKYANALRIRATLVNRATFAQAYPGMEISLTSNAGNVLARRTFAPAQYLEPLASSALTPNVVATALLDVTNPDGKAVGYEIRLVTP
jgi:hypothetical protein